MLVVSNGFGIPHNLNTRVGGGGVGGTFREASESESFVLMCLTLILLLVIHHRHIALPVL